MSQETPCYVVRDSGERGVGVYATRPVSVGETIMVGRIKEELDGNHSHAAQIGVNRFVLFHGDIALVNHSCAPNAGIRVNETGGHDFIAYKDIAPGDEICVDYAMRNYSVEHFPAQCRCGAEQCRGQITGWKNLPDARKAEYAGFVADYLLELDAATQADDQSGAAE